MPYSLPNSVIDLEATRVIVISWPDGHWNQTLRNWIKARFWRRPNTPHIGMHPEEDDQIIDVIRPDLICAKNWAIREHVIDHPGKYKHFLFIERDVKPEVYADEMFRVKADIVCCQVKVRNEAAWLKQDSFHATMWMSSRSVLERIPPPWFGVQYSADGCDRVSGECEHFRAKALAAGLSIARGGWADHDMERSWC